jgi:hypothetical protein
MVLGTNTQASEPKLTNTHSENLHGLLPATPVRPMACADQTGDISQTGGKSWSGRWLQQSHNNVPESLVDFSRPWNKNTPKTQPMRKKNPTQSLAKQHQTGQELTSNNTTQRHTDQANHPRHIPQKANTGQTGHAWAARDEQHPWVNSPKSNS